jgi:pilus assembly protein Flp/PilA
MRFFLDDRGVTSIEYALLGMLIAIVIIAGATALGTQLNVTFNSISTKIPTVS